jgi:DNA-binding transcriptional MerR regulator
VRSPGRTAAGYRQYTPHGVQQLQFVRRARALVLSLPRLKALMAALDGGPAWPHVQEAVRAHLRAVQGRIKELRALEKQLVAVLRRMNKPSHARGTGPCRCLDLDATAERRGQRDTRRR